ncbi:MAG: hypothetical protein EXR78_01570 [Deltaproteobacteria bacterium]|nr:hypothetical protein [Deltaproteobacteria bacterium]
MIFRSALSQIATIVEGVVTDIRYDYSEAEGPWTRVILSKVKAHLGTALPQLELRHFGGRLPNGRMMVASELPSFVKGARYFVFLRNTAWNVSPVVGDLALRVEQVGAAEVLVNSDGLAVTKIGPKGIETGPKLFGPLESDATAPQSLMPTLPPGLAPLTRQSFMQELGATMAAQGTKVGGIFYSRPSGEFRWRGQSTARTSLPTANQSTIPTLDRSKPTF